MHDCWTRARSEMTDTTEVRTFCRVCEPSCGLIAKVEDG